MFLSDKETEPGLESSLSLMEELVLPMSIVCQIKWDY
jgi:hypothetical protein